MGFLGVYKAIYDYAPQSDEELALSEGDILYILSKDEDGWYQAKKRAGGEDQDEPTGLVPNNYVEEAIAVGQARALYEYSRQTDEELSFPEDAKFKVFDTSDPDWILVALGDEYGFVPANYIEIGDAGSDNEEADSEAPAVPAPPSLPTRPPAPVELEHDAVTEPEPAPQSPPLPDRPAIATPTGPAAALANVLGAGAGGARSSVRAATPPPIAVPPPRQQYLSDESEEEPSPALPARPRSQSTTTDPSMVSPRRTNTRRREYDDDSGSAGRSTGRIAPGGFHMYNINEMVSVMGKKKKMPTTLGINLKTGRILIAPESASDGPSQEWTAEKMTHYSREGKHVFMELVRPSKSIDFHAGAKDTAEEIVSALGEIAGAVRAEGLREVIMAGTGQGGQKRGMVLYDFMAQGDDEVTVAVGDEVMILDDTKSEEWWLVRRVKNGKEGVVPSSYIEITEIIHANSTFGINAGRSTVAQNRLEEERLTKEAIKRDQEVGPGLRLPERHSSLSAQGSGNQSGQQRKRENGRADGHRSSASRSKPDPSRVRVWTDRSKSFSVEAQFLGVKDGKINLHKVNGVKIAVPIAKMSVKDLEYVELITGISLDEDRPLSDVKRRQSQRAAQAAHSKVGASIEPQKPEYDWFQFFLACDVAVGLCERYAQAFNKDSMDESVLPDVDAGILRNLGLREGDIIKVMRHLDKKFNRERKKDSDEPAGGLFSGPGGALKNNTRKGRPAPVVTTNDTVDAKTLSSQGEPVNENVARAEGAQTNGKDANGFEDDAWDVKPSKQPEPEPKSKSTPVPEAEEKKATASPTSTAAQPPTQGILDLSLLSKPLEPVKAQPTQVVQPPPQAAQPVQPTQPQGASPSFFTGIAPQQTGLPGAVPSGQPLNLGLGNRQRPAAPQVAQVQGGLIPPPPARPLSAPQQVQPSAFAPPPLQPQMTGVAPPGQSLNEITQQRMQQPYIGSFQPQPTGQTIAVFSSAAGIAPQPTGFAPAPYMQPAMTGLPQIQGPSPIQTQPTGYPAGFASGQQYPATTGVNSYLPPALEPQRTGMPAVQPQPTGFGNPGFGQGFNSTMSPGALQAPAAPLLPQKTGPAPPVRFGVPEKIVPQPTGRRANLAHATPENPFGF